jgi:glycosyltransferase involved in cell wall biosynthesis
VFAPLVTLTETLVEDRRVFTPRSIRARLAGWLDRASLAAATRVVIDAEAHRQYLIEHFAVPPERVVVWYLGADPTVFRPTPLPRREGRLRVLFYGSFLPLHGSRTVIEAAALLGDDHCCEFVLVGDGLERDACVAAAREAGLRQIHFENWVAYERLGEIVGDADICLGIFGTTAKARMVIPNKLYQAAAVGRPVITADTPAVREVFVHGESAWLCAPGDAPALADAVRRLCDDADLRAHLAQGAASLMAERFAPAAQASRLTQILADAANTA